jgi:hypothetical protein
MAAEEEDSGESVKKLVMQLRIQTVVSTLIDLID